MSGESYLLPATAFIQPDLVHETGVHAGLSLGLAGLILIAAGVILIFLGKQPLLRWVLPGLLDGGDDRIRRGTSDRFPFL